MSRKSAAGKHKEAKQNNSRGSIPKDRTTRSILNRHALSLLLITVIGLISYSNTFSVPFQWDDTPNIVTNPLMKSLGNFFSPSESYVYNPRRFIGYLSFALNYFFGGLNVTGYHIVNLAIHVTNAILVYFLVILTFKTPYFEPQRHGGTEKDDEGKEHSANPPSPPFTKGGNSLEHSKRREIEPQGIERKGNSLEKPPFEKGGMGGFDTLHDSPFTFHPSRFIALFSALLFVSHPIQTQAVTYIVQRFTSLATMFYLLSVVMYIKGRLSVRLEAGGVKLPHTSLLKPLTFFSLSLLFAVLAMKTKEIAFTLPFVIVLYEFTFFWPSFSKKTTTSAETGDHPPLNPLPSREGRRKKGSLPSPHSGGFAEAKREGTDKVPSPLEGEGKGEGGHFSNFLFLIPIVLTLLIIPLSMLGTGKPLGELLSDLSEQTRVQTDISRWDYLFTQFRVIVTYIRLLFLPVNQNLDYDYPIYRSFFTPEVFLSFLLLLSILGIAVYLLYKSHFRFARHCEVASTEAISKTGLPRSARNDKSSHASQSPIPSPQSPIPSPQSLVPSHDSRLIAFGILWFFLTLSVESSFIPIVDVIFEHRVYLPSVGAFIAITSSLFLIAGRFKAHPLPVPPPSRGREKGETSSSPQSGGFVEAKRGSEQEEASSDNPPSGDRGSSQNPLSPGERESSQYSPSPGGRGSGGGGTQLSTVERILIGSLAIVTIILSAATFARNTVWRDMITVWEDVAKKSPEKSRAHNNLGYAYKKQNVLDKAEEHLLIALTLKPDNAAAHNNLAATYVDIGLTEKAVEHYRIASILKPDSSELRYDFGKALYNAGAIDSAIEQYLIAISLKPDAPEVHYNLGIAYYQKRMVDQAIEHFRTASRLRPDYSEAHNNLGVAYGSLGMIEKAIEEFQVALQMKPDNTEARNNLEFAYEKLRSRSRSQ